MAQPEPLQRFFGAYKPTEAEMRDILEDAAEEAERLIPKLVEKHTTSGKIKAAQLSLILREIRQQQAAMWGDLGIAIRDGMERASLAAVAGESAIDAYLRRNGMALPELHASFRAQAMRGFRNVLAKGANGIPLSRQVYKTQALAQGWVDRQVRKALILQTDARTLAKQVRDFIDPNVKGGVSYAAFRLARTELNNAFHTAAIERYDEPWATGVEWHLSGSHPPSKPGGKPEVCEVHARVDLGLGTGVYPAKAVPPKPHPQCLCYITQHVIEEDAFLDKLIEGDYDDYLAEQLGEDPPKKDPAAQWLAKQDPKTQRPDWSILNSMMLNYGVSKDDGERMIALWRGKPMPKQSKAKPKPVIVSGTPSKPAPVAKPQPLATPDVTPTVTPENTDPDALPSQASAIVRDHIERITTYFDRVPSSKRRVVSAFEHQARYAPKAMILLEEVKGMEHGAPSYGVPGVTGEYDERTSTIHLDSSAFLSAAETTFFMEKRSGYISKCGDHFKSLDSLIAHEFGHHMHDRWIEGSRKVSLKAFAEIADALGLVPPQSIDTGTLLRWGKKNAVDIERLVSRYGATNPLEMLAEIWHEYTLGDPPRPHIKAAGDVMKRVGEDRS